jgi:hypothetical protein
LSQKPHGFGQKTYHSTGYPNALSDLLCVSKDGRPSSVVYLLYRGGVCRDAIAHQDPASRAGLPEFGELNGVQLPSVGDTLEPASAASVNAKRPRSRGASPCRSAERACAELTTDGALATP